GGPWAVRRCRAAAAGPERGQRPRPGRPDGVPPHAWRSEPAAGRPPGGGVRLAGRPGPSPRAAAAGRGKLAVAGRGRHLPVPTGQGGAFAGSRRTGPPGTPRRPRGPETNVRRPPRRGRLETGPCPEPERVARRAGGRREPERVARRAGGRREAEGSPGRR